jgi:DNA-binding winged helix-turn-helix (wHTH) protein/Tfp pilus assembly protein PilF
MAGGWVTEARIDLAHEPDFRIGDLSVWPSTRELSRGEDRVVIEPRVMQVLVALSRAGGAVVSKDDLTRSCWEGRVVGEDAINRVLSRLRKLSDGIGSGAFRIETVTRVGYRLIEEGGLQSIPDSPKGIAAAEPISRRMLIAGGGLAVLGAGGAIHLLTRSDDPPDEVQELIRRGQEAVLYGTPEQTALGISLLQQASERSPDHALTWGLLSLAYGQQAAQSNQADFDRLIERAESAGRRALELDPDNPEAQLGRAIGGVKKEERAERDRRIRALLARHPENPAVNRQYSFLLTQTGRFRESLVHLERAIAAEPYSPTDAHAFATTLWSVGRLDEADAAMESAFRRWPRHYGVWFARCKLLVQTGKLAVAQAMLDDVGQRPTGVPDSNFALVQAELDALNRREPAAVKRALDAHMKAARTGVGFTQNAMTFAATVGEWERVFELADAMFFDRGFRLGTQRFTKEQGLFNPSRRRPTYFLFTPPFAPCWKDARFVALLEALGLERYWQATRSQPDFRKYA